MAVISIVSGSFALFIAVVAAIALIFKLNSMKRDYEGKLQILVDQINDAQLYEYKADVSGRYKIIENEKAMKNLKADKVKVQDLEKKVETQNLNVGGNLIADNSKVITNNILLSKQYMGYANESKAEISNDSVDYKQLMLVGNKAGDGEQRRVGMYDRVDVHGDMDVHGNWVSRSIEGQRMIKAGDKAFMRYDGYIFGGSWIDGQNVQARESIRLANDAARMTSDGNIWTKGNVYSLGNVEGESISGLERVKLSNDAAGLANDGTIYGKQFCLDNECISELDLQKLKK